MTIIGTLPVTLTNGTLADANQVMSDLNFIQSQVNTNAAQLSGGNAFVGTQTVDGNQVLTTGVFVSSIASLRLLLKTGPGNAFAGGYYVNGDGGGGPYYYDSTDTTSADNGGTIIVANDGGRWKLILGAYVSVKQFGAKGDGATDDTAAINAALAAVDNCYIDDDSTFITSGDHTVRAGCTLFGAGPNSILKRMAATSATAIVSLSTDSVARDFVIAGNSAAQSSGVYGILGYRVQRPVVERVRVDDNWGIGIGWSDSEDGLCFLCKVTNSAGNAQGFWNDTYSSSSFYANGGHQYILCEATGNQLDGLSIGTTKNFVFGGRYDGNGVGGTYVGSLGGSGIFTLDGEVQDGLVVIGVEASNNTEFGINAAANNAVITGNKCQGNQLSGILLKGGARLTVTDNQCWENGYYTGSSNPNLWQRAGILLYPDVSFPTLTGNACYDARGGSATQEYGIRFANLASGATSTGWTVGLNTTRYNKIDNDNINPSFPSYIYANLTLIDYKDFVGGEGKVLYTTSATPDVAGGVRFVFVTGPVTITDFINGAEAQTLTVFTVSGTTTVTDGGNIALTGVGNVALVNAMSSITLIRHVGIWYETGRAIF